jgi:hypothetical protein
VVQEYSYKIYFVIFRHSYKFLRILEVCTIFWELNQLENDLKLTAQCRAESGPRLQCTARRPGLAEGPAARCCRRAQGDHWEGTEQQERRQGSPRVTVDCWKHVGDRGDPGVRGRWTESWEDGGGGGVLEHGREGVERKGERDDSQRLLTRLRHAAEGKRGRQGGPAVGGGRVMRGEHEKGGPFLTVGGQRGRHGNELLTHGTRATVGEGGRRERCGAHVGRPVKDEVGRAQMNSDKCKLFKWISNEFDLI